MIDNTITITTTHMNTVRHKQKYRRVILFRHFIRARHFGCHTVKLQYKKARFEQPPKQNERKRPFGAFPNFQEESTRREKEREKNT